MVNENRMNQSFCELVRLYAPSKGEREVCDYLKNQLRRLGASKIMEDNGGSVNGGNAGNLIAVFNETAPSVPSIALTAHMDCVECCRNIHPVLEDGVFRSAGDTILGGDDKAGVAAILEGLALMKENYLPHGKLTIIFTVQEEIGLVGSRLIEETCLQGIDWGYTFDGDGEAGTAFNAGPSHMKMDFVVHGAAAHAGMAPEKGINAIAVAAKGIAAAPTGRIDEETTCNIGVIEGGLATNIVPETCTVRCEARSHSEDKLVRISTEMEAAFRRATENVSGSALTVKKEKEYSAFRIAENSDCIRLFRAACGEMGKEVHIGPCGGGSDANWFGEKGFPSLLVGVGMTDFHTNRESLKARDLYEAGELVYQIINMANHFTSHM